MNASVRTERVWLWLEPLIAVIAAVVLYFPLNQRALGAATGILGALLTVGNVSQLIRLRNEFAQVSKLAEIADLTLACDVQVIRDMLRLYVSISAPELTIIRDEAVENCSGTLSRLAYDKISPELTSGEYHIWLAKMLAISAERKEVVKAVSVMEESAWDELPAERKFLQANIDAAKAGASISRIFITTKGRLAAPENRKVYESHIQHAGDGLIAHIVMNDTLAAHDSHLMSEAASGFIIFGSRVALIDVSVPPAEAKGTVTMNSAQLKNLENLFDRLQLHAQLAVDVINATA